MTRSAFLSTLYALGLGLCGIGALVALTDWSALFASFAPLAFFAALSVFVKRAGFHVAPQVTHSLVGNVDLAAVFIFGPILGAWVAAVSGFLYLFLNAWRREKHAAFNLLEIPIFNAGLKIGMAYASTHLYTLFGGRFPPREFLFADIPALGVATLAWFVVDHVGWGILEFTRGGRRALKNFLRTILLSSVLTELLPLPFAMVIAIVYVTASGEMFLLVALGVMGTALVVQMLADTSARLELRRSELTVLNEFGNALARVGLESEKIVNLLHEHARRIVPADFYRVEFFDHSEHWHTLLVLAADAQSVQHPYTRTHAGALVEYLSQHREPLRAHFASSELFGSLAAEYPGVSNVLCVPLFVGDTLLGAMTLLSRHPRAYSSLHARNLELMCGQAAVTIQNARLYAAEHKRAAQLAAVSEVSRKVAALLDLDELLQYAVNTIRERFGYSNVHVFTVDSSSGYVIFRASTNALAAQWRERGVKFRIGLEGIVGWVAATREALVVKDVRNEPRFLPDPDSATADTLSEVAVPLIGGSQVLGVLDVQSNELDAFGAEDLFILKTLGAQIAVAIEDARLFNSQKEEAYYLNVLLQVAQNLSTTMDLAEALETVVRITPLLVGVERCAILLYDAATHAFIPTKAYGMTEEQQEALRALHLPADESTLGALCKEKKPILIEDAGASPSWRPAARTLFDTPSGAFLLVPMISRGEVMGAIFVDQGTRQRKFSAHEIDVLTGIATQAAVAIESARLGTQAEEKKRLDYEFQLARQIQTSFLPAACPSVAGYQICSHWQSAREVSGDFYDFVQLKGGRLGITIADVSDKGMAAAMFMALSRTILRTMAIGKPTPRETIERANDVILADARSEMFVTVYYAVLDAAKHKLTYVNAGHNPPFWYRAAKKELKTLKRCGIALGVVPNAEMEEKTIALESGDVIVMYTDGVTDAINAQAEEFGVERLADLIARYAHASAEELCQTISRAVADFVGEHAPFDDLTMVVLKRV